MKSKTILPTILATVTFFFCTNAKFEFTNVACTITDKDFGGFQYCYIKAHNRSLSYLSIRINVYHKPTRNTSVRWALLKRANGYKPFLYNISFDGCEFLRGRRANPVSKYFYGWFKEYSNINHSCPFEDDFIVDKLDSLHLDRKMTATLPMPKGQYCFYSDWLTYGINRANIRVYFKLT